MDYDLSVTCMPLDWFNASEFLGVCLHENPKPNIRVQEKWNNGGSTKATKTRDEKMRGKKEETIP